MWRVARGAPAGRNGGRVMEQAGLFAESRAAQRVQAHREAERRRDVGIERAGDHADREHAEWRDRAATLIGEYAECHGRFLIEDVVPFARAQGLPDPPDGRAWGAAAQRARRVGLIRSCGYAPARSSNLSPKVQWERA